MSGGEFTLLLIEKLNGRKFDEETRAIIDYAGFVFLVLLGIYLLVGDLGQFVLR